MSAYTLALGRFAGAAPVIARVIVGTLMFAHGLDKLDNGPSGFGDFLDSEGVPLGGLMGWVVTLLELVGGPLLIVGPDTAVIHICDTGIGIPPEDLPDVFERFYRARNARDRDGTGLGLAIARHITEQHGGTISARSELGVGTRLAVSLPRRA